MHKAAYNEMPLNEFKLRTDSLEIILRKLAMHEAQLDPTSIFHPIFLSNISVQFYCCSRFKEFKAHLHQISLTDVLNTIEN